MANYIIIALLIFIIAKEITRDALLLRKKPEEKKIDKAKEQEMEERLREFNNLINYSIDKAIESKRGDR